MKLLSRIIGRLNVLSIRFEADGKATIPPLPPKGPVVMVVSGKGVITKEASAGGIVDTVTSDPETFMWTVAAGTISFIRREQLATIIEELEKSGLRPLYIECLPGTDEATMKGVTERFNAEYLKWRRVLTPSADGSALASIVAKRAALPVLGVLMLILIANFVVSGHVRENFQEASAELTALRRSSSALTAAGESRRILIEEFSHRLPYRASRLSDRIGGAVPEKIALGEISIAPLLKTPESGKPVRQNGNTVVIRGETSSSKAIAEFTDALGRLRLGTIRLTAVEQQQQQKGHTVLTFRIEITL